MLVTDFVFPLPEELIAQKPSSVRGASRMLQLNRATGGFADGQFAELPKLLAPGDLLVLNDSRVLPARLFARRAGLRTQTGQPAPEGLVEVLLTERISAEGEGSEVAGQNLWQSLVKPAKKVAVGERLLFFAPGENAPVLRAEVVAAGEFGERTLRFAPVAGFHAVLERIGFLPLPPYIRRSRTEPNTAEDRERYQTVYSRAFGDRGGRPEVSPPRAAISVREDSSSVSVVGSAAAPTAGLHFTPEMLERLRVRGVEVARVTLHVGVGTFQPVRVKRTEDIRLHAEPYTLSPETAQAVNRACSEGRRVIAVGTTTTRTLEHLARQFESERGPLSVENPLRLQPHSGSTGLFLSPGPSGDDRFLIVGGLLTNFHLPQSTLLMLVSAFAGREKALAAYAHAVSARYKFFSYGDCMLIL